MRIKRIMKIILLVVVFAPFLVKAHFECPWASQSKCTQRASQQACLSKSLLNSMQTSSAKKCTAACQTYRSHTTHVCKINCPKDKCIVCMDEVQKVVDNCKQFNKKAKGQAWECNTLQRKLIGCCSDHECKTCRDPYCQNGGVCKGGPNALSCKCPQGFTGIYCQKSQCTKLCQNGGKCTGPNTCKCTADYKGPNCEHERLGTKLKPAPNAQAILDAGDNVGSGLYWIQPPGEDRAIQTYCDMKYSDGGWMLASYGYVASLTSGASGNRAIPNMNNPMGYAWRPDRRASRNGVINLPHGAVMMARKATYMMMAAGNNPNTGIDKYTHVYRIDLRQNIHKITFANHNKVHGATGSGGIPKMHVVDFLVVGLKGDVGEFERFALAESLGITWPDTYPTGYGFNEVGLPTSGFNKGPFFPSVHSGDGHAKCHGGPCRVYEPDVSSGAERYVHRGWYSATSVNHVGQTSIWFK